MGIILNSRVTSAKPSATLAVSTLVTRLQQEGNKIINLSTGELDFPTPPNIVKAIQKAGEDGHTTYTQVSGTLPLRQVIANNYYNMGLEYAPSQVIVSNGAKHSLALALQALLNEGDEVIIPDPYWVSYPEMVGLSGGKPVIVDCNDSGGKLTPEKLYEAITPQTKILILNSPSNPKGEIYSGDELFSLARVLEENADIVVISDDIYRHIVYDENVVKNIAQVAPQIADRTVIIDGLSKSYAATGLRVGWAAGPKQIIDAMTLIQGQSTSNVCSVVQYGAIAALSNPMDFLPHWVESLSKRRDYTASALNAIEGIKCDLPKGAFYLFPDISRLFGKSSSDKSWQIQNDIDICNYFLHEAGVAFVPGSAFGSPNNIRMSFATSTGLLVEAMEKVAEAVAKLS